MLTEALSTLIGFFLLLIIIFNYVKHRKYYELASYFPGPKTYPIIGNANLLAWKKLSEQWEILMKLYHDYPSPCRLWMGNLFWVHVYKPEQVKIVLTSSKSLDKSDLYKITEPCVGKGLFSAPASTWRGHRKLIQPAFNPKILRSFVEVFEKHSKILMESLSEKANGVEFPIAPYTTVLTINVTCESTMGLSGVSTVGEESQFSEKLHRCMNAAIIRASSIWLYPDIIFKCTQLSRDFNKCVKYIRDSTSNVNKTKSKLKPFLDLILELNENEILTDQELNDETCTMIIAATDTLNVALQFIILVLASFPDVQEKIFQELKGIFSDTNPENISITAGDLLKMEYLERVIKEGLRIFPPIPFIIRKITEDLDIGDYTIPKGAEAFVPIAAIHRSEEYWPDPFKFDSNRFLPEEIAKRHPYTYLPFSAGPRNCIGLVYAMLQLKAVLARIVLTYVIKTENIKPLKDIKVEFKVMLFPTEPITVNIKHRKKENQS